MKYYITLLHHLQPSTNGSIIIHIADKANTKPATDKEHFDTREKLYLAEINPLSNISTIFY